MGAAGWEFRLFGPLEIRHHGVPVVISAAKQQVLIAALLTAANGPVTIDRLIACLWGDQPPHSARNTVQNYVLRLRRALTADDPDSPVVTLTAGYRLDVPADAVDLRRFESLVRRARAELAAQQPEPAATLLRDALRLWRGEPLVDVPSDVLHREVVPALVEQRLTALELRIEADLLLGRQQDLVTELVALTSRYPLRERLWASFMVALYRCGRPAEALDAYHQASTLLAAELGVDPGPELRGLHQRVLANDPALAAPGRQSAAPLGQPVVPRQLPASPRPFTGRATELNALTAALREADGTDGAVLLAVIRGTGGIGKTWLALQWARQHLDRWPDGQLFVDLHGFSPTGEPRTAASVVREFLDTLGVDPAAVPVSPDAQLGLYRSLLADRRMLILLDNARDAAQVTPLLPGSGASTVLVTSRNRLDGLVTRHGARSVSLDVLAESDARAMLSSRLGRQRMTAEPDAAAELLACCAGFPLALSVVAGRAEAHPGFPLALLAAELQDVTTRLDVLDNEDPAASLPAVLSWSSRSLSTEQVRLFRLLGVAPGPDISTPAVAALAGLSDARVRVTLPALERVSLVQQHVPDRYQLHDLVRLCAANDAERHGPRADSSAALRRLVDFYLHTAYAGDRLVHPNRPPIHIEPPVPGCQPYPLTDRASAMAWFDAEYACLLAAQQVARDRGWNSAVWQLAWAMDTYHQRSGHPQDQLTIWQTALSVNELLDPSSQAQVHLHLGRVYSLVNRHTDASHHLDRALALSEPGDDPLATAHAHFVAAQACELREDIGQGVAHASEVLRIYQTLDNPVRQAVALNMVGYFHARLGDYEQGRIHCTAALALLRDHQDPMCEAATLDSLGYIAHHTGDHTRALNYYHQAIALRRDFGHAYAEALVLDHLGETYAALGRVAEAGELWRQALELYRNQQRADDVHRIERRFAALHGQRAGTS